MSTLSEFGNSFAYNFSHNLFKPLLLFFYAGFLIPIFKIKFEFPTALYQTLTLYLLLAIGWHGGEELAVLPHAQLNQVWGLMVLGFFTNLVVGIIAYNTLRWFTPLRRVDAATVGAYYGSDSAGTFVTAVGVLTTANIAFAPYMPVMLAVMELPGCLVGLYLANALRRSGMDAQGNMPGEPGYTVPASVPVAEEAGSVLEPVLQLDTAGASYASYSALDVVEQSIQQQSTIARRNLRSVVFSLKDRVRFDPHMLHEVFFNPGIYLLFAGIFIGFVSRLQGPQVVMADDAVLVALFQGALCFFLLEMGITASRKLKDLKTTGWPFIAFALTGPIVFASAGMSVLHLYSHLRHLPLDLGTYALFGALSGSASYIAMPAVQRLAIPEASPTLPLAASLGLTFTFNVTIGISLYIEIARQLVRAFPL